MSTFIFNGRKISIPGVYAEIKSGVNNPLLDLLSGNVLIIDKDATSVHGNGSGIAGEFQSGKQSLYFSNSLSSFRQFVGGGFAWDIAQPLFRPFGSGAQGASNVYYARALTTTAASLSLAFDAGTLVFKVKNEGVSGNGALTGTVLTKGYSARLEAGSQDSTKYVLKFFRGTFKGNDPNSGQAYDDIAEADTVPELISRSPELSTLEEIVAWTLEDNTFIDNFVLTTGNTETGAIIAADLTGFSSHQVFAGGTSTYATERITDILNAIKDMNINFIITTDIGANAGSVDNVKIATFLDTEMPDPATLIVGGGKSAATFSTQSIAAAATFNSQNVIVVHGECNITNIKSPTGVRLKSVLYKVALVTGRLAGLDPQIPLTYKGIDIAGEAHDLSSDEKAQAINGGVLATAFSTELGFYTVVQGVNTIQNNTNVVNSDGTSSSISVVRIAKQLIKELKINAIIDLLGDQQNGPNRNTLDSETVRVWVSNYLKSQEASFTEDDLIIDSRDVTVEIDQDAYKVSFGFTPNYEVNKIFITARILDDSTLN